MGISIESLDICFNYVTGGSAYSLTVLSVCGITLDVVRLHANSRRALIFNVHQLNFEMTFSAQATADGSQTFYSEEFGEAFHSRHGALTEAWEKFTQPCQLPDLAKVRSHLCVIDVCYGLGYNTAVALTKIWENNPHCQVTLWALEQDPVVPQQAIAQALIAPFPALVQAILRNLAQQQWEQTPQFQGRLFIGDARQTLSQLPPETRADAIFLDPFSPPKCPQLWTVEFLTALGDRLATEGCLATYCSAAAVRQGLTFAGLHFATLPRGDRPDPKHRPLGTLASRQSLPLPCLPPWEQEHLRTQAAIPYRDPSGQSTPLEILERRRLEQVTSGLEPTSRWKKRWLQTSVTTPHQHP